MKSKKNEVNKRSHQPPGQLTRFINWLVAPHLREEVLGDLEERYARRVKIEGKTRAKRRYWLEALAYMRPAFIKRKQSKYPSTAQRSDPFYNPDMILNYFKIAFRNLSKNRGYSFINITGLAAGMTCTVLIFMVVRHETGYDKDLANGNRIYRLETENIKEKHTSPGTYTGMAQALRTDLPEAELVTPLLQTYGSTFSIPSADKRFRESVVFTDNSIFGLVNYRLVAGNASKALGQPNSVVLTKSYAIKYFGTADVMGKTIRIDNKQDLVITGILEDLPVTTSFPFKMLVSFSTLKVIDPGLDLNRWNGWNDNYQVFVLLKKDVFPAQLTKRFTAIAAKYMGKEALPEKKIKLNPLSEIHYSPNLSGRTANVSLLKTLSFIGLLVLLIACFNFINLSTAQAFKRAKEVGIRKAIGSNRRSLIYQFLVEAGLVTFLALLLAVLVSQLSMQSLADILAIPLSLTDLYNWQTGLFMTGLAILTTLLAGVYPAFRLSGMAPAWALKNHGLTQGKQWFSIRQGLVVVQFTVSLILINSAFLINRQLAFFRNADLGFDKAAIITVGLPDNKPEKLQALRNQLTGTAQIQDVSFSFNSASSESNWMQGMEYRQGPSFTQIKTQMKMGDSHYLSTYGIQLLAGNALKDSDTSNFRVLANEVFIKRMGITRPQDAIGVKIYYGDGQQFATIAGVTKNFHVNSLHQKIDPALIQVVPNNFYQAGIKLQSERPDAESLKAALTQIEKVWIATFPEHVFEYSFLDETLARAYQSEIRTAKLIETSTFLAILIACLGLFGLATFTAEQRTKEIGVRKVLGASVASLMALLSKDFFKLILIAIIIASPIAWLAIGQWLQNFEFKIEIKWWMFAVTGLSMTAIAMLTVSFQSVKAALMNPVKSLRSE
ncbi:FtsX-like permease family protein [Dyadobacter frigoris]|uniref:FtsX-like permease family protein n=1 Tax=Dyadobacter frigoris TaxID=2576211 RepID=A0A4U6CSM5_9BACT|nr:FtsX-like permease family protein [Dyadobacter frigoris]TKT87582.1 FtsX-like permease family protein [Dyadobacter frigoris]GLU52640.1 ABC transporter permease [Dyadobacter frigoris]